MEGHSIFEHRDDLSAKIEAARQQAAASEHGGAIVDLLNALRRRLSARLAPAEFEATDEQRRGDVEWLEYRRLGPDGAALLGIRFVPNRGLVLAELWRQAGRHHAYRAGPGGLAAERRAWAWGGGDPEALAARVAEAVGGWVDSDAGPLDDCLDPHTGAADHGRAGPVELHAPS